MDVRPQLSLGFHRNDLRSRSARGGLLPLSCHCSALRSRQSCVVTCCAKDCSCRACDPLGAVEVRASVEMLVGDVEEGEYSK